MKNLFLSVVLLLTVSFAFANNDLEKIPTYDAEEVLEKANSKEFPNVDFIIGTSNSFKDDAGSFYYTLTTTITYSDGSTSSSSQDYMTEASSLKDCRNRARAHAAHLNN